MNAITKYFRDINTLNQMYYDKGKEKGTRQRDAFWTKKIETIKAEAVKTIKEKNEAIAWRDKKIKYIENTLSNFKKIISRTRFLAIQSGEIENTKFLEAAKENKIIQNGVDEIESLYREVDRKAKPIEKKIEKYNIEKFSE